MSEKQMQIDLVYLWVNGNDPLWQAKRNEAIGVTDENSAVNCDGRYTDNDELKYSLRSACLYAPWIRKIFIVTDNQVPAWLDTNNPKIRIIDHKEILSADCLPTFNSVVIEHALHKIPGLSEHFLYANDDMFFNREVSPADFFTSDGLPIIRMNRRPMRKLTLWLKEKVLGKPISNYNLTIENASRLVKRRLGKYIGHKSHHNIDAYTLANYRHTAELFEEEIRPTLRNKVRSDNDIQRNIYSYVPMAEDKCKVVFVDRNTSFRFHIDNHDHYAGLSRCNPMLFCLNDSQYATPEDRKKVREFLETRFPDKSPYEK